MINAIHTQTQGCFALPASARVAAAWTPALPTITGAAAVMATRLGAAVQGTGVSKHRVVNDGTFPGTSVWRPPT